MKTLIFSLFVFISITFQVSAKEPPSLEDIKELAQYNIRRIPELQNLWKWMDSESRSDIFWTGSSARGFWSWHYKKLQTQTIEELRHMPAPGLKEFLPRGGYDIDLVGPIADKDKILSLLPKGFEMDIIDQDTYQKLVELGGPTIGKIILNPIKIVDPLQGLEHYHKGQLVFKSVPEKNFRTHPIVKSDDYSKTEMALRFIRLSYDLPELQVTLESVDQIKDVEVYEKNWKWTEKRRDHVAIILEKILIANKGDVAELITRLVHYNLLSTLATARIGIPTEEQSLSSYLLNKSLSLENFSLHELRDAEEIVGLRNKKTHLEFLKLVTPRIKNFSDLLTVSRIYSNSPVEFTYATNDWILENIAIVKQLNPNAGQILDLFREAKISARAQITIARELEVSLPKFRQLSSLLLASLRAGPQAIKSQISAYRNRSEREANNGSNSCLILYLGKL
ncbi:MAG: hypothetical protein HUU56_03165 [Bdellovibrionaceae bacterium]|nr:hypothetical protein [Pseudobdellovibrionaceae bacterium]